MPDTPPESGVELNSATRRTASGDHVLASVKRGSLLKLRAMLALPAWLGLIMAAAERAPGELVWVLPSVGYIFAVLPVGWFPALLVGQVAVVVASIAWTPSIAAFVGWLGAVFLGLAWLLNGALYLRQRQERAGRADSAPSPAPLESPFDETPEGFWEPGIVEFALDQRMFRVTMMPGSGHANGGIPFDVEMGLIPFELRMPNTRIMARRAAGGIVAVRAPGPKAKLWFDAYVDQPRRERQTR